MILAGPDQGKPGGTGAGTPTGARDGRVPEQPVDLEVALQEAGGSTDGEPADPS